MERNILDLAIGILVKLSMFFEEVIMFFNRINGK